MSHNFIKMLRRFLISLAAAYKLIIFGASCYFFALFDRYFVVKIQSGADSHGVFPNELVTPERERVIKVKGAIRVTAPDRKGPKTKGKKLAQS
ncbi:hypothetical protein ACTGE3_004075 [Escherichia coli]